MTSLIGRTYLPLLLAPPQLPDLVVEQITASGNTVHNLRALQRQAPDDQAYDWAIDFDQRVAEAVAAGDPERLAGFQQWGDSARLSHPSHDHYLPLLYAAGAAEPGEAVRFFNEGFQAASISMRSMVWG